MQEETGILKLKDNSWIQRKKNALTEISYQYLSIKYTLDPPPSFSQDTIFKKILLS